MQMLTYKKDLHELSPAEIKAELIKMLYYLDAFFTTNNLKYSITSGTMLGAVRHGGFIPWDDDIDVGLPRVEYNKFIEIAQNKSMQVDGYDFIGCELNNSYWPFIKMINRNIIVLEGESNTEQYLWIDIFPFDYLPRCLINIYPEFIKRTIKNLLGFKIREELGTNAAIEKTLSGYRKIYWKVRKIIFKKISTQSIARRLITMCTLFSSDSDYVIDLVWGKKAIPQKLFADISEYQFADISVKGIKDYDTYLSYIYGNYMKLPPIEQRENHGVRAWRKAQNEK